MEWHLYDTRSFPDLMQGDVLRKEGPLLEALRPLYPYFAEAQDYKYLMVLTQSCDLVRRRGQPCKARYITLCAVRPLSLIVERELEKFQKPFDLKAGVCSTSRRQGASEYVSGLLNNNRKEYFYLRSDRAGYLPEDACAILQLTITIRADHYGPCIAARCLSLSEVFRAKLGWHVAECYARVGTEDWAPEYDSPEEFQQKINLLLDGALTWVKEARLKIARKGLDAEVDTLSPEDLQQKIGAIPLKTLQDEVAERIHGIIAEKTKIDSLSLEQIRERIRRDKVLKALLPQEQ